MNEQVNEDINVEAYLIAVRKSDMPSSNKLLAMVIAMNLRIAGNSDYLSNKSLAQQCGLSIATVGTIAIMLNKYKWISLVKNPGKLSTYTLLGNNL